jgi:hypothetical protein
MKTTMSRLNKIFQLKAASLLVIAIIAAALSAAFGQANYTTPYTFITIAGNSGYGSADVFCPTQHQSGSTTGIHHHSKQHRWPSRHDELRGHQSGWFWAVFLSCGRWKSKWTRYVRI